MIILKNWKVWKKEKTKVVVFVTRSNLKEEKGKLQVISMDVKSSRPFEDESSCAESFRSNVWDRETDRKKEREMGWLHYHLAAKWVALDSLSGRTKDLLKFSLPFMACRQIFVFVTFGYWDFLTFYLFIIITWIVIQKRFCFVELNIPFLFLWYVQNKCFIIFQTQEVKFKMNNFLFSLSFFKKKKSW